MKAAARLFKARKASMIDMPNAPKGVVMDVESATAFMTQVGPMHLITVTNVGPRIIVWYWEEKDGDDQNEEDEATTPKEEEEAASGVSDMPRLRPEVSAGNG